MDGCHAVSHILAITQFAKGTLQQMFNTERRVNQNWQELYQKCHYCDAVWKGVVSWWHHHHYDFTVKSSWASCDSENSRLPLCFISRFCSGFLYSGNKSVQSLLVFGHIFREQNQQPADEDENEDHRWSEVKQNNKNIFCLFCVCCFLLRFSCMCFNSCGSPYKAAGFHGVSPRSTTAAGIHSNAPNYPITVKEDSQKGKKEKQTQLWGFTESSAQLQGGISSPNLAQWAAFLASNRTWLCT